MLESPEKPVLDSVKLPEVKLPDQEESVADKLIANAEFAIAQISSEKQIDLV